MGRTWLSSKRTAMPSWEARKTIWLPSVMRAATSSSPCFNSDGVDAVGAHVHELAQLRFLHQAVAGGEEDVLVLFFEIAHGEHGLYGFAGLQADQVADVLAFSGGADVGDFVDLEPVDAALVGEDENVGVRGGDEEMLDEILVARLHAGAARASAALHAVGGDGRALHVAGVADGDGDLLVGDEIFEDDFGGFVFDARAALVAVELLHFFEFFDDDVAQLLLGAEDGFVFGDVVANFASIRSRFHRWRAWSGDATAVRGWHRPAWR